jgi:uncharacterized C2H2 Zn-finger protein
MFVEGKDGLYHFRCDKCKKVFKEFPEKTFVVILTDVETKERLKDEERCGNCI